MFNSNKRHAQREGQKSGSPASQTGSDRVPGRYDGNRDPVAPASSTQTPEGQSANYRNVDFSSSLWSVARGARRNFEPRKAPSTLGREVNIGLNAFPVTKLPEKPIHQYSVTVGGGQEKRGLIKKVWESRAVQTALGPGWIFDGNALAWNLSSKPDIRINVDLDAEQGRQTPPGRSNVHRISIKPAAVIKMDVLHAYLKGQSDPDNTVIQAVTVLDHIMRQTPSGKHVSIKRSFFPRNSQRKALGGHVDYVLGVYQSLRMAHHPAGARLVVNVDVANGTFWATGPLSNAVLAICRMRSEADIGRRLTDRASAQFSDTRRFRRLRVVAAHRKGQEDDYVIDRFLPESASKHVIKLKGAPAVTVQAYFQQTHNLRLNHPDWPVVQMANKRAVLPLELLKVKDHQRYNFKLDETQTAQMIKNAVTPPSQRWSDIQSGVNILDWRNDPYIKNYGMGIDAQQVQVKARLLQNPKLQFGGAGSASQHDPRTSGRWDLKGKKFLETNKVPLKVWGVCVMPGRSPVDQATVQKFVQTFVTSYVAHGGSVSPEGKRPEIFFAQNPNPEAAANSIWNQAGNKYKSRPQILMFILQSKDSQVYGLIKKTCEIKLGVVSQCVQFAHVQRCQPQYISNVLMKFNAKLGGFTNRAIGPKTAKEGGIFKASTVIVGCDVSHAAPGLPGPSMAAMTVSVNRSATRYAAFCETNGYRLEMVTAQNIQKHLMPMMKHWSQNVGAGRPPAQLVYFRDGVSEGQFSKVLDEEVKAMRDAFAAAGCKDIKFVVIIGSKRHHVRFFPKESQAGDRNGNPLPGTLVESGVTQPYENDFYLNAHVAIKGTARPVHYNILLNEAGMSNEELQTLIYEHSYQYVRATTPVSQFPAIYYAHIASNRAAHHSADFGKSVARDDPTSTGLVQDFPPLQPMASKEMNFGMWYI